jgi:hypothetical protein
MLGSLIYIWRRIRDEGFLMTGDLTAVFHAYLGILYEGSRFQDAVVNIICHLFITLRCITDVCFELQTSNSELKTLDCRLPSAFMILSLPCYVSD